MKHYGDITKINGALVEPVNVIIGGSPCQDLSVAGKQAAPPARHRSVYVRSKARHSTSCGGLHRLSVNACKAFRTVGRI